MHVKCGFISSSCDLRSICFLFFHAMSLHTTCCVYSWVLHNACHTHDIKPLLCNLRCSSALQAPVGPIRLKGTFCTLQAHFESGKISNLFCKCTLKLGGGGDKRTLSFSLSFGLAPCRSLVPQMSWKQRLCLRVTSRSLWGLGHIPRTPCDVHGDFQAQEGPKMAERRILYAKLFSESAHCLDVLSAPSQRGLWGL